MREAGLTAHQLTQNHILRIDEAKTLELIELYKEEECLWNSTLDDYPNKSKRAKAADKIAQILNIPNFEGRHVMMKFKNLRNSYSQELKKIKQSMQKLGPDSPDVYRPKVQWFGLMDSFIRPHLQVARLPTMLQFKRAREKEIESSVKMEIFEIEEEESWAPQQLDQVEANYSQSEYLSESEEHSNHSRAKRRRQSKSPVENNQNQMYLPKEAPSTAGRSEDTFDNFGRYIASLLRGLPAQDALRVQPKIVDMIVSLTVKRQQDARTHKAGDTSDSG
uniref:MADF domain-containing protein n=1 Tax=Heliothis virescens TaxID=7102 RepID=A0A2A4JT13_HELVI